MLALMRQFPRKTVSIEMFFNILFFILILVCYLNSQFIS